MRVIETLCDPTMFDGSEATGSSVGDNFEINRIPLTPSKNNRSAAGFAIHEWLGTVLPDGKPKLQIYAPGCPQLVKTLPEMEIDRNNPERIKDGNDHYVISLAYFCMGAVIAPKVSVPNAVNSLVSRISGGGDRFVLGNEGVRRRRS
jgi:hypothetical protein